MQCLAKVSIMAGLIFSLNAHAFESFSHSVLSLPDHPRIIEPWYRVIETQQEWEHFFNQTMAHMQFLQGEAPQAPELDFENYQVISGGLGEKSSAGYELVVKQVTELETQLNIHVLLIKPSVDCLLAAVISYPSTTILVKKTAKPLAISISEVVKECK